MIGRSLLRHIRRSAFGEGIAASAYSPFNWRESMRLTRLLWRDYGHLRSVVTSSSIDGSGAPVPWYTYPAISYLRQLDFSEKTVFEYGCGNSTLFWAAVARQVVSVEDDRQWFDIMSTRIAPNTRLVYEPDLASYVDAIRQSPDGFDIIVVDGPARGSTRLKCSRAAIECLRTGGLIVLDNSDWLPESARLLRNAGLLEVDMTGFAPISAHTQTTSFFFSRAFDVRARGARLPELGVGSRDQDWEARATALPAVEWEGEVFGDVSVDERFTVRSPAGDRTFRVLVYRSFAGPTMAILDVDRNRVLLSWHVLSKGKPESLTRAHADAARVRRMSWNELRAFVNGSRKQHYLL